jgi:hypothetical protein
MTNSPKDKATAQISAMQAEAAKDLEQFETIQKFEMAGECTDKNGEKTRVLIVDTDADGILGLFMEIGQPFSFSATGDIKEDSAKVRKFMAHMSNVDLSDGAVQKAVGWAALGKAREVARAFFMLRLVSDLNVVSGQSN